MTRIFSWKFLNRMAVAGCATLSLCGAVTQAATPSALVNLAPTQGHAVHGYLSFVQLGDKVLVSGTVQGLQPNAEHGFHIHEKGDCSKPDGTSAGGHFNPSGALHGKFAGQAHHAGDLPSLKADAQGVAQVRFEATSFTVNQGSHQVLGRGVIVHKDPDDFTTQPTGNSGARLACGVIVTQ